MDLSLRAVHGVRDAVWVIRIAGDIDVVETSRLVDALRTARQEGTGTVVLDLRAARHVATGAIHAILSAKRRLAGAGRRLVVACDADSVSMTVPLSGLSEVLPMYPDVDAALAAEMVSPASRPAAAGLPSCRGAAPPPPEERS